MISEPETIGLLAVNEFRRLLWSPVAAAVFCVLVALAVANALGSLNVLPAFESWMTGDVFVKVGLSQEFFNISQYCSVAALIFGVLTFAEDRRRAMGVLLTKPVLQRDVLAGKFVGISLFMLLLISATYLLVSLLIAIAFRGPLVPAEFLLRLAALILSLLLECSLLTCIGMLIGIVFTSLKEAIIVGVTYLCVVWFSNGMFTGAVDSIVNTMSRTGPWLGQINPVLGYLSPLIECVSQTPMVIYPYGIYFNISGTGTVTVFDTSVPFGSWMSMALPYIALMAAGVVLMFAIDWAVITRTGDAG